MKDRWHCFCTVFYLFSFLESPLRLSFVYEHSIFSFRLNVHRALRHPVHSVHSESIIETFSICAHFPHICVFTSLLWNGRRLIDRFPVTSSLSEASKVIILIRHERRYINLFTFFYAQEKIPSSHIGNLMGFHIDTQQISILCECWESETVPNVIFVGYFQTQYWKLMKIPNWVSIFKSGYSLGNLRKFPFIYNNFPILGSINCSCSQCTFCWVFI